MCHHLGEGPGALSDMTEFFCHRVHPLRTDNLPRIPHDVQSSLEGDGKGTRR